MPIHLLCAAALQLLARVRANLVTACRPGRALALVLCTAVVGAAGATGLLGRSDSAAVVENAQIRAELVAHAPQGIAPGQPLWLGLQLRHASGWHTYWRNPGDSGLATELNWTLPPGWQAGPIEWPLPQRIAIGTLANYGYEGEVLLPVAVTLGAQPPAGTEAEVKLHASWLVCREECIPQEGDFVLRLPLRSSYAAHASAFAAARAAVPRPARAKDGLVLEARVDEQGLVVQARGLPAAWQGQAIDVFPLSARVYATAASPLHSDALRSGGAPQPGTQVWQGAQWSARLPLSPQRMDTWADFPVVLAHAGVAIQASAPVQGIWPALDGATEPAALSPALAAALSANAASAPVSGASWAAWGAALAAAFVGGLILNLMPCVLPVLAIKTLGLAGHRTRTGWAAHAPGLAYTAGVLVAMLALAGLLLVLRAGGEQLGWGFQMQSPPVVVALALLFALIGLNLMGWLEFGQVLPAGWAGVQLRHPLADAFFSGVLAVAVASPCSAPFMGASLGLALTLPAAQALGIFVALGLGLALPFALASSLPQLAARLPRPGPWMLRLRQFMVFPMAATVLWLLWVLGHMAGVDAAAALAALLLALALALWGLGLQGLARAGVAALGLALAVASAQVLWPALGSTASVSARGTATPGARVWEPWSAQAVQAHLQAGEPVFVDFTAAWCITCQYNKQTVLSRPEIVDAFAAKGVRLMRADWTLRDPAISAALGQLGRSGVPVYVLYRRDHAPLLLSELLSTDAIHQALAGW